MERLFHFFFFSSIWSSSATLCPQLAATSHIMHAGKDLKSSGSVSVQSQLVWLERLLWADFAAGREAVVLLQHHLSSMGPECLGDTSEAATAAA